MKALILSVGVVKGRHAPFYRYVASEMKEAGALCEDIEVVVDGNFVSSRQPSDLPAFMRDDEADKRNSTGLISNKCFVPVDIVPYFSENLWMETDLLTVS